MKLLRYLLVLSIIIFSVSIAQAQDSRPLIDTNLTLISVIAGVTVLTVVFWIFRRDTDAPPENFTSTSVLVKSDDGTEQYILDNHSPIILESQDSHAPVKRPENDSRPYLVFVVQQSMAARTDGRFVITPDDTPFVIGSRESCDFHIDDRYVSGQHLHIDYDEMTKSYILTDRNSSNGTYWNGEAMFKKRPYPMRQTRDLTLEIAVNHIFRVYVDIPDTVSPVDESPVMKKEPIVPDVPVPIPIPAGIIARLSWESPETRKEQNLEVTETVTTIGRGDEGIDARINHDLISKLHAYLIWKDNQFWLVDASSNGTWLATDSQPQARLEQGAYVPLMADTSFEIEVAFNTVQVTFRYTVLEDEYEPQVEQEKEDVTDKLPELPPGLRPKFHIVRDGESEKRRDIPISTSIITIGQAETNIISIQHDSLLDIHAQIIWSNGQFWYEDLSKTGLFLNNRWIRKARTPLEAGEIHEICLNKGQFSEIIFAFYYDALQTEAVEHTQKIE